MSGCCGIDTANGVPVGTPAAASAEWTERFLGDFAAVGVADLTVGVNPTITVINETPNAGTPGFPALAVLASNANDADPSTAMGAVGSFGTDGATGLVMQGASATTNFTTTAHNAPHVFALWSAFLGEDPRPGVDYAVYVRFASPPEAVLTAAALASGIGIYWENDGSPPADLSGNPGIADEKALRGWFENVGGTFTALGREGSTTFQEISGARLPADVDTVGLLFRGGGQIYAILSVGDFVDPDRMIKVPGGYQGGSVSFPGRPYLEPTERLAIPFQQQIGSTYDLTAQAIRVVSRGGAPA